MLTAVVFRAPTLQAAWNVLQGLVVLPDPAQVSGLKTLLVAGSLAVLLPSTTELCRRLTARPRRSVAAALGVLSASVLLLLGGNQAYDFIYFQF